MQQLDCMLQNCTKPVASFDIILNSSAGLVNLFFIGEKNIKTANRVRFLQGAYNKFHPAYTLMHTRIRETSYYDHFKRQGTDSFLA